MDILDQTNAAPDPKTVSMWPTAIRYGALWGGVSIVTTLVSFLTNTDPSLPSTGTTFKVLWSLIGFGVAIWAVVMAIKTHRDKELGGYITLGRGIGMGVLVGLIAGVISGAYMLLHILAINPDWTDQMKMALMEQWVDSGIPESQAEEMLGYSSFMFNSVFQLVGGLMGGVIMGLITGLIAGAILKRDAPKTA